MNANSVSLWRVDAPAVRPLRQRVLRPHQRPEELVYPGDDDEHSGHFARWLDAEIVAIASVFPQRHPEVPDAGDWRLRGMASAPEIRGAGHGRDVLRAALAHARALGGERMWCNARATVLDFYRHHGFETRGEEFELPGIGPHFVMTRDLADEDLRWQSLVSPGKPGSPPSP